jgi:MoaA/NifB/PqqE/SkfB family radical SAM enzyme
MFRLKSPLLLILDITNRCNLNCKYCYQTFRKAKNSIDMPFKKLTELLEDARSAHVFDINICGGEPFLHKDIIRTIDAARRSGFGLSINTNGTLINHDIVRELSRYDVIKNTQVSFDSHLENIHNATRNSFSSAYAGFITLVDQANSRDLAPSVGIVLNRHNVHTINETIVHFSQYTSRFHLMNLMNCSSLSCTQEQKRRFNDIMLPQLQIISKECGLQISSVKKNKYEYCSTKFSEAHIDCLAGYTSLVVSSDFVIHPCDIVPFSIGKWRKIGDLLKIYQRSLSLWEARQTPWCYDFANQAGSIIFQS